MYNQEIKSILRSAKQLLSDKNKHCDKYFAVDSDGKSVAATSDKAVKWCALGATNKFLEENSLKQKGVYILTMSKLDTAARLKGYIDIAELNDNDYNLIGPAFDLAIEMCEVNNQIKNTLVAAKELISDPNKHCIGAYARDISGNVVSSISDEAIKWCSIGAVIKCANSANSVSVSVNCIQKLNSAARQIPLSGGYIESINDHHPELISLAFDLAIKLCDE